MSFRRSAKLPLAFNRRVIFILCLSLLAIGLTSTTAKLAITYNSISPVTPVNEVSTEKRPKFEKRENQIVCPPGLTVDDDGDAVDMTPGDGTCATAGSVCTLRAAIEESNALGSCGLTINFSPGTHTIQPAAALPAVTSDVTIEGPTTSPDAVTVDGQQTVRVFEITTATTVAISNLTIVNGESGSESGGGLLNSGAATVNVSNSSFFGNNGGTSGGSGGGAVANTGIGTLNLTNSTLDSNTTSGDGAAVYGSGGTINILNSTIAGNVALDESSKGGGIANSASSVNIKNTIVAINFAGMAGPDVFGVVTSQGHNLISDGSGSSGFTNGVIGDQVGSDIAPIDPRLDFPANNGGTTDTVLLLPGSPAIDAGDDCIVDNSCVPPTGFLATDQRGVARPQGNHVDIGAFELEGYVVNTTADPGDGTCTTDPGGCTLREAIEAANNDAPAPRLIAFNIPADDPRHYYYSDNVDSGVSAGNVATTTLATDAIPGIDSDYAHSWWSIAPVTPLPFIDNTVFLNGYSQPGASLNTKHFDEGDNAILRIELTGVDLGSGYGLDLEAGGSTVSGLVINNFADVGIFVCGYGFHEISGNFIGTDVSGTLAQGSTGTGIDLGDSDFNLVGGDATAARNLISGHASGSGVDITTFSNIVEGNYIGTDRNGLAPLANQVGVKIHGGSAGNVLGCEVLDGSNLISGNTDAGVLVDTADVNLIIGNFIGTDSPGTGAIANGIGVHLLDSSVNFVAFIPGSAGNVISGNTGDGVLIQNSSPSVMAGDNFVQGNLIGTDKTGLVALANGGAGVEIDGSSYNEIGSAVPDEGNVISGNTGDGVEITNGASFNFVRGNFIGVGSDGTSAVGNGGSGVEIYTTAGPGASDNIVGFGDDSETETLRSSRQSSKTAAAKQTNASRASNSPGRADAKQGLERRVPKALAIGREALHSRLSKRSPKTTSAKPPNLVSVNFSTLANLILPPEVSASANVIANNGGDGVKISNPDDINNLIKGNSIYSNTRLGINLVGGTEDANGVTTNDALDSDDPGPNHLQNFPAITGADAGTQLISGELHSSPGAFQIDFYRNVECDGSGHGEGKTYLGSTVANADGSGDATFTFNSPIVPFTAGQFITATATDVNRNTSEFSTCFTATGPAPPSATPSFTKGPDQVVAEDSGAHTIPNWATDIVPGPETGRTVAFIIQDNTNPGLFSAGPTISPDGTLSYTAVANANGSAVITVALMQSGGGTSPSQTFVITVTEVNDAPAAANDTIANSAEDSAPRTIAASTLTGNDSKGPANESGQTLTIKTVGNALGGTVSIVSGNVVFTLATDYNGPASFQYTVEDNGTNNGVAAPLTSGSATVNFTITEVNDAPDAVDDGLSSVAEDSGMLTIPIVSLLTNDSKGPANESGQMLTLTGVSNAVGGTVTRDATNVYFTPTTEFNGAASFQYTITDNGTTAGSPDPKSDTATVSFTITGANDAPAAVNDVLPNIAEDSGPRLILGTTLTGNDVKGGPDEIGQTLTIKTVVNVEGGTVAIVNGDVVFTPTPNYHGPAVFTYTTEDNGTTDGSPDPKTSGPAVVQFNITPVADTPSVTNATTNANTQTTSGLVISRNPVDGAEVTHFKITGITGGTLFKNNGTTVINNGDFITFAEGNAGLKFTPGTTNGSFQVQASTSASDAGLGGGTVQATITINPLGGVIRFSAANYSVAEGAGFTTITVERTGDTSQAVTVDYASSDHSNPADSVPCSAPGAGFASSRCDFTTAIGTLKFAAGETSKTFNVLITNDNYVEGPETLELSLSNPTNGAVFGVPQTAILSITDDASEPATNPVDNSADFVRAQYHDILSREPDAAGLAFWTDNIEKCNDPLRIPAGQTVAQCIDKQRETTAIAFFMSPEFQMTGGYVYHLYKGSLTGTPNYDGGSPNSSHARFPTFLEFMRDMSQVSEGIVVGGAISGPVVEANRNALAAAFVLRPEFVAKYGGLNNTLFVDELFNTTGIAASAADKQALVDGLTGGTETRASVLRKVVDGTVVISESNVQFTTTYGQAFITQENNRLFVFLEYIGYLRRNPDTAGFVFWLGKLNFFGGDPVQAEMVKSFILSPEYRNRFGQP